MTTKETISLHQYFTLSSAYLIGVSTLIMPLGPARQDAWLSVLLAMGAAVGLVWLWGALNARFPEATPYIYVRHLLGGFFGPLLALLYALYFTLVGGMALRAIVDLYVTAVMPRTPLLVFTLVLAGLAAWLVLEGLEPMARLAELLLPVIVLFILLVTLFTFQTPHLARFERLLPLLEQGWGPPLRASPFGEAAGLALLAPFLNSPGRGRHSLTAALLLGGLVVCLVTFRNIVVLGPEEVGRVVYPSLLTTREINLGDFLQRIEVLLIFIWTFGAFFKIAVSLHLTALGLGEVFAGGRYRPFVPGVAAALVLLSILFWEGSPQLLRFYSELYPFLALPLQAVVPALLLVVAVLRGAGSRGPCTPTKGLK